MTKIRQPNTISGGESSIEGFSILDLRETPESKLLDDFIVLYNKTFTDPQEREDPADWPGRMWQLAPPPQPRTHLLVALSTPDADGHPQVIGGLVFEHYRTSHCGLLTYLVIEQGWRRKGIARSLVEMALSILVHEEQASGHQLLAAFLEVEDPRIVTDESSNISPIARLHAMLSLGARLLDVKYVQPPLAGGSGPCDHLLLLAFDLQNLSPAKPKRPTPTALEGRIIHDFLYEFYRALGISRPKDDRQFREMALQLQGPLTLQDPRENPALNLNEVAVCLHYVQFCLSPPEQALAYPGCRSFQSMELDLMSYGYQVEKLLGSKVELHESIPVVILFPERVDYHTEGRHMLSLPTQRSRLAKAMVSSTLFLVSGIRIWHIVLVPENDEVFNEFDIIKFIHLYDGRTESTELAEKVKFLVRSEDAGGRRVTIEELPQALLGDVPDLPDPCLPTGGTVQIISRQGAAQDDVNITQVMEAVQAARAANGGKAYNKLAQWIRDRTPQGNALLALCGIVTGIFDFTEVDEEEVLDTMEPTFASQGSFIRVNRCTIVSISEEDRAMMQVKNHIGLSPYLLIPHAALLHNEALIDDSEAALCDVAVKHRIGLTNLENARQRMERNLNRFYLPNIFNYITEKTLFASGSEGRGTNERLIATRAKLNELDGQIKSAWAQRHHRGQMRIAALMAVFTVLGLRDVLYELMKGTAMESYLWWDLFGLAGVVVLLYILWGMKHSD